MKNSTQTASLAGLMAELPVFAGKIQQFAADLQLDLTQYQADHISLRAHDTALAEQWLTGFRECGTVLSENQINGRPIYLFLLHKPLTLLHWQIPVLELPFPKGKQYAHQGWEHIELVLPGDPLTLTERAAALLPSPLPDGVTTKASHPRGGQGRAGRPPPPRGAGCRPRHWRSAGKISPLSFIRLPCRKLSKVSGNQQF